MEKQIIEIFEEFEHQFETTGYYGSVAGYGVKREDYTKLAERLVKLIDKSNVITNNKVSPCEGCKHWTGSFCTNIAICWNLGQYEELI